MTLLDLQLTAPSHVARAIRMAVTADDANEKVASLLYSAHLMLRIIGVGCFGTREAKFENGDFSTLSRMIAHPNNGDSAVAVHLSKAVSKDRPATAINRIASLAKDFLDVDGLCARRDDEVASFVKDVEEAVCDLGQALKDVRLWAVDSSGRLLVAVGVGGQAAIGQLETGVEAPSQPATWIAGREGATGDFGPSAGDPLSALVPWPGVDQTWETAGGLVVDLNFKPAQPLAELSPMRALGRLLLWELGFEKMDKGSNLLSGAGFVEAAVEWRVAAVGSNPDLLTPDVIEILREITIENGLKAQGDALVNYLLEHLIKHEAELRTAEDFKGVSEALLSIQQLQTGKPKIVTLTKLANVFSERLGDHAGEYYCLASILEDNPNDSAILNATIESAKMAGLAGDAAKKLVGMTGRDQTGTLAEAAVRLFVEADRNDDALKTALTHLNQMTDDSLLSAITQTASNGATRIPILQRRLALMTDATARAKMAIELAIELRDTLKDTDSAITHFRAALGFDPVSTTALDGLIDLLVERGDGALATEECAKRASASFDQPFRVRCLRKLADIYKNILKRPQDAYDVLAKIAALDGADRVLLEELAENYIAEKRWDRAQGILRALVAEHPEEAATTWMKMADIALDSQDDPVAAMGYLNEAARLRPYDPEPRRRRRDLHEKLGLWADVARDLELAVREPGPEQVDLLEKLADVYSERLSQRERSKGALERAVLASEGERMALFALRLADLYREDGQRDLGMAALEKAVNGYGNEDMAAEALTRMGKWALEAPADRENARRSLEKALEINPVHEEAVALLARLMLEINLPEQVSPVVDPMIAKALEAGNTSIERHLRVLAGHGALRTGNREEALRHYERAVALGETDLDVLVGLGRLLASSGQDLRAVETIEGILDGQSTKCPVETRIELHRQAGRCALRINSAEKALFHLSAAFRAEDNTSKEALEELADVADKAGDMRLKAMYLEKLIAKEVAGARRFTAMVALGDAYGEGLKDSGTAIDWYMKAANEGVSPKVALHKALNTSVSSGDFGRAKTLLVTILEQEQDGLKRAEYHQAVAMLARDNLGDKDLTLEHLQKAVELNPDNRDTVEALKALLKSTGSAEGLAGLYGLLSRHFKMAGRPELQLKATRELARTYLDDLHNPAQAAVTLEQVLALAPRDIDAARQRAEALERVQGMESSAIDAWRLVVSLDATDDIAYSKIRDLCLLMKDSDGAWCASSALTVLGMGDETDRQIVSERSQAALKLKQDTLPADGFKSWIVDEAIDEGTARLFSLLYPPLATMLKLKRPQDMGLSDANLVNLDIPGPFNNMALAASQVLGTPLPRIYHAPKTAGIAKAAFNPPALIVGDDALTQWRGKELRFALGRAAVAFYPGFELAGIIDSNSLKLTFLAALRVAFPDFPLPDDATGADEMAKELSKRLTPEVRTEISTILTDFRRRGATLDTRGFLQGIDRTAARAGLFMANDLEIAGLRLKQSTLRLSDLEFGDSLVSLCAWAVSDKYAQLRRFMLK